jgi:hypothetical protein
MKRVEEDLRSRDELTHAIYFIIQDENFLRDRETVKRFHALNREKLTDGTLFLSFLFADAGSLEQYSVDTLLEMGVDAVWVGMESCTTDRFIKNRGVDIRRLVRRLQANGIKVFISFISGMPEQDVCMVERDAEFALSLEATGYQYAPTIPIPGTRLYDRLKAEGRLNIRRPEHINLGHYNVRHDEFTEADIMSRIHGFHILDYERNGPLVLRYMKLRLSGYLKHRNSANPALRARARGFRNDLMEAAAILSAGPCFAPNDSVRADFISVRRRIREAIRLLPALFDLLKGRTTLRALACHGLFANRLLEPFLRWILFLRILRFDPRSRERCETISGFIRHHRSCMDDVKRGIMPWGQPKTVRTSYNGNGGR